MKHRTKNIIDLILNLVIVISTLLAVGCYFVLGPDILGSVGADCFKYFTTDSNILVAIVAVIMLIFNVRRIKDPNASLPKWVILFKYVATVSVTITLLVVVFFLAPMGYARGGIKTFLFYFKDNIFALHLSTPVISIISFALFEKDHKLSTRDSLWALIPTVVYSVVYLVMVVFVKRWTDWYGFTFGGKVFMIPVSMIGMYLVTFLVATALRKIRKADQ